MDRLENLQADLAALQAERVQLINEGWYLQHCWLVQVKPGGTARTNRQYWQVRSRQAIFDGKKLKHLKPFEVENYRAAIARGQRLKQIDAQIKKLQQQIKQRSTLLDSATSEQTDISSEPDQDEKPYQNLVLPIAHLQVSVSQQTNDTPELAVLTNPALTMEELIVKSQKLRREARQTIAHSKILEAANLEVRKRSAHTLEKTRTWKMRWLS